MSKHGKAEATPTVQRVINGYGLRMIFRAPKLSELTTVKTTPQLGDAMKGLIRATLIEPKLSEIEERAPGYLVPVFNMLNEIFGSSEHLYEDVPEDQLNEETDKEAIEAWARAESKDFQGLFAIRFTPATKDEPMLFVLRRPRAHELDAIINNARSHEIRETLAKKLCVYPEADELANRFAQFPYISFHLAGDAWGRHGLDAELTLGEV